MPHNKVQNVGLIFTTSGLSAVEVKYENGQVVVTNYAKLDLAEGILERKCILVDEVAFGEAVKKLFETGVGGPIKTENVLISMPEETIFSHRIAIPKEKIDDIEFIKEAAKDFIPINLAEATFDYKSVSENEKEVTINFVATQNSIIEPIIIALKTIGIKVVGVGISDNCLLRSFHRELNKTEGDTFVLHMNSEHDLVSINKVNGGTYKQILNDRVQLVEKLKAMLNLSSNEELQTLLINTKKGQGLNDTQKNELKVGLKGYLEALRIKIVHLINAVSAPESIQLKNVYLTGEFSAIPGVAELLNELFPELPIKTKPELTEIPDEIESDVLEGIGLCMKGIIINDKDDTNLLPKKHKEQLNMAKLTPKIRNYALMTMVVLVMLVLKMGISTTSNYLKYQISSKEVVLLSQQSLNPYLTQIARNKQEMLQQQNQLFAILQDSLPVSHLIDSLNEHNRNGIALVNVVYNDRESENESFISIRAKADSRPETEAFVEKLEQNEAYKEVLSPLSNLVGKGERFINITVTVDKPLAIQSYANSMTNLKAAAEETDASQTPEISEGDITEVISDQPVESEVTRKSLPSNPQAPANEPISSESNE